MKLIIFAKEFVYYYFKDIMPTVLRIGAFRFHFYSDEYNEPLLKEKYNEFHSN
ncbi:hypothetical protein ACFLSQ_05385 [Bacteroidota bacterium]